MCSEKSLNYTHYTCVRVPRQAQLVYEACPICSQVFYVDYGNCGIVNLSEIRQWDDSLDCYPLQALECKLDNIIKLEGQNVAAIAFFESRVLQNSITATIT